MLNVVAIMGRIGNDLTLKTTNSGKSVCSFRIACDRGRKDANGQSVTDWLDVVAWNKTAEFVGKYFHKGSLIAIDGRLTSREYEAKDGGKRTAVEIVASGVNFAGAKDTTLNANATHSADMPAYSAGADNDDFVSISDDGDLPF